MAFTTNIVGTNQLIAKLGNLPIAAHREVASEMQIIVDKLYEGAAANLSGGKVNAVSGKLLASLKSTVADTGDVVTGTVQAGGPGIPYAAALEYGVVTKPHDIVPINGKALAFLWGGRGGGTGQSGNIKLTSGSQVGVLTEMSFFTIVHHPGSKIPAFAYLRSALAGLRSEITARFHVILSRTWTKMGTGIGG